MFIEKKGLFKKREQLWMFTGGYIQLHRLLIDYLSAQKSQVNT